jgi:hypothetical protein
MWHINGVEKLKSVSKTREGGLSLGRKPDCRFWSSLSGS